MLGISYGELFLLLGATAALIGAKDLPVIARTAGRLAGRAIGYVQLARGQFENVLQQSQARQVHKELQDAIAQLEAIRYEIRSISIMNPGPMTRGLMDNPETSPSSNGISVPEKLDGEDNSTNAIQKDYTSTTSGSSDLHSQATTYARLAESAALKAKLKAGSLKDNRNLEELNDKAGLFTVLPVSAESTRLLPDRRDDVKGSDIVLEAVLEAEVAHNAKHFFAQAQNQIQSE
ncbi:PREDICTED: uncharacterized protein LOC104609562 [Nelumbo nucifera]|uniref:Uncharacterized protein LOC104609562 n=1 Tax=Nelumbo nucifera TaxID=4432 RepID=A0A1U8B0Q5_NELNU|nr:PREDICTED: uncharacterized protein LOC104609562 [Nelumbo nucifera]